MHTPLDTNALLQSRGTSDAAIHALVVRVLERMDGADAAVAGQRSIVDVGCGSGALAARVAHRFGRYIGIDGACYDGYPRQHAFVRANLDGALPLASAVADAVVAIETIEHLENPWQLVRELARIARPGGIVIVTTPNQLSALSKGTLLVRHSFNAFQDVSYPAHRTALVERDLRRTFEAARLHDVHVEYSQRGRIPGTATHYPRTIAARLPRLLSDNVLIAARKP